MAGINLSSVILYDRWPGPVNPNLGMPVDGWDNTVDNYKTTAATDLPAWPLGTKIMTYSDNSWAPGWYTMIYLEYHSYESGATYDVSNDISDGFPGCAQADGSTAAHYDTIADNSTIPYYVVTRCLTTAGGQVDYTRANAGVGAIAVPCCSMSSDGTACITQGGYGDFYGWFWCGGVCPAKDITFLDDNGAGIGSTCAGIGACCSGSFATKAHGALYFEVSDALSTGYLTNDISDCFVEAGDISFCPHTIQPIGWSCMTAV